MEKNKLIKLSLEDTLSETLFLSRLPSEEEWKWINGAELLIKTKEKNYKFIFVESNEFGLLFYNKIEAELEYYEEIKNKLKQHKIEEVKIIIPEPHKLIENYLKGITVYILTLTEEVKLNEKKLNYYTELVKYLSNLLKNFE